MRKKISRSLFVIFITLLLSACWGRVPSTPAPTPSASSVVASATASATSTRTPTQKAATRQAGYTQTRAVYQRTPSSTPAPTRTPIPPTPTPLLQLPEVTRVAGITPIATPALAASRYRLRVWSAADALDYIVAAQQDLNIDTSVTDYAVVGRIGEYIEEIMYQNLMQAIYHAAAEALLQTDQISQIPLNELRWYRAGAGILSGQPTERRFALAVIEDALNRGEVQPQNLAFWRPNNSIVIQSAKVAPADYFGDGQLAYVFQIGFGQGGHYYAYSPFIVRTTNGGAPFQVYEIPSTLDYGYESIYGYKSADLDNNSHAELYVLLVNRYFSITHGFEWNGSGFKSVLDTWDGHLEIHSDNTTISFEDYGNNTREITYTMYWNGSFFNIKTNTHPPTPVTNEDIYEFYFSSWLHSAYLSQVPFTEIQNGIKSWLGVWPHPLSANQPALPDYLRFQLGLAYALNGEREAALQTLRYLRDAPVRPDLPMAEIAAFTLEQYQQDDLPGLWAACQQANALIETHLQPYVTTDDLGNKEFDDNDILAALGFGSGTPYSQLCNSDSDWLNLIFNQLHRDNLPASLRDLSKFGIVIRNPQPLDADGDGREDWLFEYNEEAWLLLATESGWTSLSITYNPLAYIQTVSLPDSASPALLLKYTGDSTYCLLQVQRHGQEIDTNWLIYWFSSPYEWHTTANGLELWTITEASFYDAAQKRFDNYPQPTFYRWLPEQARFAEYDRIAELLYEARDFAAAQKLIMQQRSRVPRNAVNESARLRYLLALTYELQGNDTQAIAAYWQVWRDYPQTVYARMAQFHLVEK